MLATRPPPGDDPVVVRARGMAAAWLERVAIERLCRTADHAVLGHGDPNLANFLWDGGQIRLIDFEDSGQATVLSSWRS